MIPFPKELMIWISSLPEPQRTKETMIAERNLLRIHKYLTK